VGNINREDQEGHELVRWGEKGRWGLGG